MRLKVADPRPSIEDVKSRVPIVEVIGRDVQLRKRGRDHWACCPIHAEKTPSFKVSERYQTFHCFGCDERGDVFDYLRLVHGLELDDAREHLAVEAGLMPDSDGRRRELRKPIQSLPDDRDEQRRIEKAKSIWRGTQSLSGTVGETYLYCRGLKPGSNGWPPTLRFHSGLRHDFTGRLFPAMVAAVCRWPDQDICAVHCTYLRHDGTGKAQVEKPKLMRGPCSGGAVRLAPHGHELVLAEGIENALTVQQESGLAAWAALSTSGLRHVILPDGVQSVIIAADSDTAGETAAQEAARKFVALGRKVKIARPPAGMDFNDLMKENVVPFGARRVADG